ncbi:MAG: IclR family transcriptional regulator [Anaerolineae bacterium]
MAAKTGPYSGTQAVMRAMSLLEVFSDERPEWSLTDLAGATGLNRTTAYRLLTALASYEMVARNPDTDRYRLGPGVIVLAGRALRANPLRSISRPELERLTATTGETATLEVLADGEVLIIDEVVGERLISGAQSVGTRWPAFATSTGNAILAYLPEAERERILRASLPQITPKTVTEPEALRRQLARVREVGYAVVAEGLELGYVAVGAPVCDVDRRPVAAISLGGPTVRLDAARIPHIGALVRQAAERLSRQLGYRS